MRKIFFITIWLASFNHLLADIATENNYTGSWTDTNSWNGGTRPSPVSTNIANAENIDIYGYITRDGDLSFGNLGNNSYVLTVHDTLVVKGSLSFASNAISLEVADNGVLVVFGDFIANNKVDLDNGGTMVITGDMTLNGGNQDYFDNGGGLYVDGDINGNGDVAAADAVDAPSSDLNGGNDDEQDLFDFVQGNGESALPITLGHFDVSNSLSNVYLSWSTLTEDNFDYFEILRSTNGEIFEVIAAIKGNGFSTIEVQYSYTDYSPKLGTSYYQLRAIDFDGSEETFSALSTVFGTDQIDFTISVNSGSLFVDVISPFQIRHTTLEIYDSQGRLIIQSENNEEEIKLTSDYRNKILIVKMRINDVVVTKKFFFKE